MRFRLGEVELFVEGVFKGGEMMKLSEFDPVA